MKSLVLGKIPECKCSPKVSDNVTYSICIQYQLIGMEESVKTFQKHLCHGNHRFLGYKKRQNIHQITSVVFLKATISDGTLTEELLDKI